MKRSGLRGLKTEKFEWEKEHQKTNRAIWVIRILVVLAITFLIWAQNNLVVTRKYVFASSDLPKAFVGYRIVHVSDICNTPNNLVAAVKHAKPDVIIISGGFEDENGNSDNSVKAVNELCDIAPVYYIYNTNDKSDCLSGTSAINITDQKVGISPKQVDLKTFIVNNYGDKLIKDSNKGDEQTIEYLKYVQEELTNTANSQIYVIGAGNHEDAEDPKQFVNDMQYIIGTDSSEVTMLLSGNLYHLKVLSKTDVDMIFTGGTFGRTDEKNGYSKGLYGKTGAQIFVCGGIGNLEKFRVCNLPQVQIITLSDGTIRLRNPLEELMDKFMGETTTIWENDGGLKEKENVMY